MSMKTYDEVRLAYMAAYNAGDAAGIAALFTDDCVSMPPERETVAGRDGVARFYAEQFTLIEGELDVSTDEAAEMGDWAYGRGAFCAEIRMKDGGDAMTMRGKYMNILKRQPDGGWKIARHIWNTPTPLSMPPG